MSDTNKNIYYVIVLEMEIIVKYSEQQVAKTSEKLQ